MQDRLIQRYLGNKSSISKAIIEVVNKIAAPNDLVFDAFSGTLSVSAALRSAGYRVAGNDINHFTWTFATAYFTTSKLPFPDAFLQVPRNNKKVAWEHLVRQLVEPYSDDIPIFARRSDFFDHYCEEGSKSAFTSSRGTKGNRRFFSPRNATLIDRALSRIRFWHQENDLSEPTRCILISSILSAVEKISNTQGTFHDFPRNYFDPRAKQVLKLIPPRSNDFFGLPSTHFGKAKDTLEYVKSVPKHKVLYLDPPYNFRQYTSYYFMLNMISEYVEIEQIDDYFARIEFVRGQNMDNDFKSPFCGKATFIPALKSLIARAKADYVVLSYFDGRNHWGEFKSDENDLTGKQMLQEFFTSELFIEGTYNCTPVQRMNYQSYGGHKAREVNEYIFVAQKSRLSLIETDSELKNWTGRDLELPTVSLAG